MNVKIFADIIIATLCGCVAICVVEKWFWSDKYQFGNLRLFCWGLLRGALIIAGITYGLYFLIHFLFF